MTDQVSDCSDKQPPSSAAGRSNLVDMADRNLVSSVFPRDSKSGKSDDDSLHFDDIYGSSSTSAKNGKDPLSFKSMDRNHNGRISQYEAIDAFHKLDKNEDGVLTGKERSHSHSAFLAGMDRNHDNRVTLQEEMRKFDKLDRNDDGAVSRREFFHHHGHKPHGPRHDGGGDSPPPTTPEQPHDPPEQPHDPPEVPPPPSENPPPPPDSPDPPGDHQLPPPVHIDPNSNFTVKDGQIFGRDGKQFVAKGLNVDGRDANKFSDELLQNFPGLNFIRLYTSPDGVPHEKQTAAPNKEAMDGIQQFIDKMTSRGIVVEVENHSGGTPTGQELQNEMDFYKQLAEQNKNNPYVWFGSNNEPGAKNNDVSPIVNEQQHVYDTIRGTGNNNMIMFETAYGDVSSNDAPFRQNEDFGSYKNVAIDAHWYGHRFGDDADKVLGARLDKFDDLRDADGRLPVIIGEYGPSTGKKDPADIPLADRINSVEAVQRAVNNGEADGAVAWHYGHVTRDTWDPNGANAWFTNDGLIILSEDRSKFEGLSAWGEEVAQWIETGKIGT